MLDKILIAIENFFGFHKKCYSHCGMDVISNQNSPGFAITPVIPGPLKEIPYTIEGDKIYNTDDEESRLPKIQEMLNRYVVSQQFHDYMVEPLHNLDLDQCCGITTRELVVQKILNSSAHIVVRFYYNRWTTTIGYRNPGENIVYCNRKYHDNYSIQDEMSNILHEFMHIIDVNGPLDGFQHDFEATARRPNSVNYKCNSAAESSTI